MAPSARAWSSLPASTSTTTIGSAPTSRAPITADSPTPPAPRTSSACPAHSPTTLSTAPTPGDDGAPGDGGDARRHAVGHGDDRLLRHHDPLGEARDAHEVVHLAPVEAQARGAVVGQAAGGGLHRAQPAQHRLPLQAVAAAAAARPPEQRDAVAGADALDARAHRLDLAGALVPDDHGQRAAQVARHVVVVAVADPGRVDAHLDLAGPRRPPARGPRRAAAPRPRAGRRLSRARATADPDHGLSLTRIRRPPRERCRRVRRRIARAVPRRSGARDYTASSQGYSPLLRSDFAQSSAGQVGGDLTDSFVLATKKPSSQQRSGAADPAFPLGRTKRCRARDAMSRQRMTHFAVPGCRLRVPRSSGPSDSLCPGCGAPLVSCRSRDVVGYRLWAPEGLPWTAAHLDAVAQAVAKALPDPSRSM